MHKPSVYIYGMPIHAITNSLFSGIYGNATRSVGLAFNLTKRGHKVYLEVENGFANNLTDSAPAGRPAFVLRHDREKTLPSADVLLISCTGIESFEKLHGRDPYLPHRVKVYTCCFDLKQSIDTNRLAGTRFVTFNNELQKSIWDKRKTGIPSFVIPYGVSDLPNVDESIQDVRGNQAIWIGEIRRADILERILRFATFNPDCVVKVVTRKIFDQDLPTRHEGGSNNPFWVHDRDEVTSKAFSEITKKVCNLDAPGNVEFLGAREGENDKLLGSANIGLDFSRFPAQTHDNTKILDYLRSGLAVVCDHGTPSARFVSRSGHGVVVSPNIGETEIVSAYRRCVKIADIATRKRIASETCARFGCGCVRAKAIASAYRDKRSRAWHVG